MEDDNSFPTPVALTSVAIIAALLAFFLPTGVGLVIGALLFAAFGIWAVAGSGKASGTKPQRKNM